MNIPPLSELTPYAETLPSLPEAVRHIITSLEDDNADVDSLTHHINADPAILAKMLSAANSAASGVSQPVCSARQAFLLLGVKRVTHIVLASALFNRFDTSRQDFDTRHLWRHTMGVAVCARTLAEHTNVNPELAFSAGLLHDIGQLLMFHACPAAYLAALDLRDRTNMAITDAERTIFSYDHAAAGQLLADYWQLPHSISDAIAAHHDPDPIGSDIGDLTHVSEVLSHALDLGNHPDNHVPPLSDRACANLGISWNKTASYFAEIEARYTGICTALCL